MLTNIIHTHTHIHVHTRPPDTQRPHPPDYKWNKRNKINNTRTRCITVKLTFCTLVIFGSFSYFQIISFAHALMLCWILGVHQILNCVSNIYSKDCNCLLILFSTCLNQLTHSTHSLGGCQSTNLNSTLGLMIPRSILHSCIAYSLRIHIPLLNKFIFTLI